jgi:hypothetical protein
VGWDLKLLDIHGEPGGSVVNLQILTAINEDKKDGKPKIKENWREQHEVDLWRNAQRNVSTDIR